MASLPMPQKPFTQALVMLLHCVRRQHSVSCSAEILEAPGGSHLVITHKSMARAFLCTALAPAPHLVQILGHEQWRGIHLQVCLLFSSKLKESVL